jgi:SHS2 domain-containing protein
MFRSAHEMRTPNIEYLDHPADVKFRVHGRTIEADDCKDLLYDFLSELLYLFEVEEIVFGRFDVEQIEQVGGMYHLRAHVSGEPIDQGRHRFGVGVKAVTFHDMVVERADDGYTVQVLVDT